MTSGMFKWSGHQTFDGPRLRVGHTLTQPTPWGAGVKVDTLIRVGWSLRLFGFTKPVGERDAIRPASIGINC